MQIQLVTQQDLAAILEWLEDEYRKDGEGFWSNKEIIARSLLSGELWVVRSEGVPVAFQVGAYGDIVCVRQLHQRQGIGGAFFAETVKRAIRNDVNILRGTCSPVSSLPFWKKHGYITYREQSSFGEVHVYRVIEKKFSIPTNLRAIAVDFRSYREHVDRTKVLKALIVET